MRTGGGPTVIEADTYRYFHQNGAFAGSAFGYRSKDEERSWRDRDPIRQLSGHLVRRGILGEDEIEKATARAKSVMVELGDELLEDVPGGKPGQRRIKPAEWPDPDFRDVGLRGDLSEFADTAFVDRDTFGGAVEDRKFVETMAAVLGRRMDTDPSIVIMGEDIHRLNGGTNGATRGLTDKSRRPRAGHPDQ